jgi:hypothetical protein
LSRSPGLSSFFASTDRGFSGRDTECACAGFVVGCCTGLGGFVVNVSGRGLWHISQAVSSE